MRERQTGSQADTYRETDRWEVRLTWRDRVSERLEWRGVCVWGGGGGKLVLVEANHFKQKYKRRIKGFREKYRQSPFL